MKKLLFLLSFSILFQSCFSYKRVGYNDITSVNKQKIQVAKLAGDSYIKGRLVSKNDDAIILDVNGQLSTVLKEEISSVEVRKLSFLKSAGVVVIGFVVFIGLLLASANQVLM